MLRIIEPRAAADGGQALQHLRERVAGEADELMKPRDCTSRNAFCCELADLAAELVDVRPRDQVELIGQLISVGDAALRIVELVAERRVTQDRDLAQSDVAADSTRDRGRPTCAIEVGALVLLIDVERERG